MPRQFEREGAAATQGAGCPQIATHPAREIAADGEPEAHPLILPCQSRIDLHERLEHAHEIAGCDAPAGIAYDDRDRPIRRFAADVDVATRRGELDGVR